jgi:hypothetical protein
MKIIILEMLVVLQMCIVGMTWQLNQEIAQLPELAATDLQIGRFYHDGALALEKYLA